MGAPEWFHFRHGKYTYEPSAYSNDGTTIPPRPSAPLPSDRPALPPAEYFADVARVYREEIQDLYARGCREFPAL